MYDWLSDALQESSEVITANRRLARVLADHYAEQQVASGRKAWKTPSISSLQDWLVRRTDAAGSKKPIPARLNTHQSRLLWEQCLENNLRSAHVYSNSLVRQAQDAWARLCRYRVPPEALRESVRSLDQRVFADAAAEYAAILEKEGWVDSDSLPALVTRILDDQAAHGEPDIAFAGFDRLTPADIELRSVLEKRGSRVSDVVAQRSSFRRRVCGFENADAEMRAAGAWARQELLEDRSRRVGIVAVQLERDADRLSRLVREGLAPGWQTGGIDYEGAVNVSFGRRLTEYPAVATALSVLGWLQQDMSSAELCCLLRSTTIGVGEISQRIGLEMRLRDLPSMSWTPERFVGVFSHQDAPRGDFIDRVAAFGKARAELSGYRSPSEWAVIFDTVLDAMNWPGEGALGSAEFQLVNRWRELLNDFARLELVATSMSIGAALSRIRSLAAETVYQPEAFAGGVQLMGPLEAAGMEFDALWIAGLSSANWPPQGNPSALLSRDLQRAFEMPDFEPSDTLAYATRVLRRLANSSDAVVFSYPLMDGDAEQSPSGLLREVSDSNSDSLEDPGWYARTVAAASAVYAVDIDPVPAVKPSEDVAGGTATIQRQLTNPFSAFAAGRLGVSPVPRLAYGLPAIVRGRIIHSALAELYRGVDSLEALRAIEVDDLERRIGTAARQATGWLDSKADAVVRQLLQFERRRIADLLHAVVDLDLLRPPFSIVGLEVPVGLAADNIDMSLRADRIDRDSTGLIILDYKTGRPRKFLGSDGDPEDMQLVAYACAIDEPTSGLALVNVDSRHVDISGAGVDLTPEINWEDALGRWRAEVRRALNELQEGDVRVNGTLSAKDLRPFGLLSRVQELTRAG